MSVLSAAGRGPSRAAAQLANKLQGYDIPKNFELWQNNQGYRWKYRYFFLGVPLRSEWLDKIYPTEDEALKQLNIRLRYMQEEEAARRWKRVR